MIQLENLGNFEFVNCFLSMHYMTFGYTEKERDKRGYEPCNVSQKYLAELFHLPTDFFQFRAPILDPTDSKEVKAVYEQFLAEAFQRGLCFDRHIEKKDIIYTEDFSEWQIYMKNHPTYIREISATNFFGDNDICYVDHEVIGFDYPVRSSCKILSDKGYHTYWSSANYEDAKRRYGEVMKDQAVAYILIDSKNLTESLKTELLLDGSCDFWGIATSYSDFSKYYGIWSPITSLDMRCEEISGILEKKALDLPVLTKSLSY